MILNHDIQRRLLCFMLWAIALAVPTAVVLHNIRKGEFWPQVDEPVHAVTGLYFADLLTSWPVHPIEFTYQWYAHYPALGLIHWPPFFHLVEAVLFIAFGRSIVTARMTVLLFSLLGFWFWFRLVRELEGQWAALVSTIFLALLPGLLPYEKSVMLEMPSLSLCIVASYFWVRYLSDGIKRHLYWFAFFASLALLTKQLSVYLAVFCLLTTLLLRKWRLVIDISTLKALAIVLLLTGPVYGLAFWSHSRTIISDVFQGSPDKANRLVYYWLGLHRQAGWPILALGVLGFVIAWARKPRENALIMTA